MCATALRGSREFRRRSKQQREAEAKRAEAAGIRAKTGSGTPYLLPEHADAQGLRSRGATATSNEGKETGEEDEEEAETERTWVSNPKWEDAEELCAMITPELAKSLPDLCKVSHTNGFLNFDVPDNYATPTHPPTTALPPPSSSAPSFSSSSAPSPSTSLKLSSSSQPGTAATPYMATTGTNDRVPMNVASGLNSEVLRHEKGSIPPSNASVVTMRPIGRFRSCFKEKYGTPRQGPVARGTRGYIELESWVPADSLDGLQEFSHCWIIFWFHQNTNKVVGSKVRAPRLFGDNIGVFASRAPHRFNPIGQTLAGVSYVATSESDCWYRYG